MLVAGVGQAGYRAQLLKILQRLQVTRLQVAGNGLVKLTRPVKGLVRTCITLHGAQVVHDVAAGHNQYALLTQGLQLLAQRQMFGRRAAVVHAELDDRNVRRPKHRLQNTPGPMIQAPLALIKL